MSQCIMVLGIVMLLSGILVPGQAWIELFRTMPGSPLREQLLLGTVFFRTVLGVFGVAVFFLPRLPYWRRSTAQPLPGEFPEPQSRTALISIGAILAVAFALRLYKLGLGLWYDEVLTHVFYARLPFGEIVTTYHNENQHFVFTLLAHASFLIFGEGPWALRLPAMLFGVASIWALYLIARQVGSTRQALLAAALFTFSYHHIWFSQNARGYSGLLFWTLFSSWLLLKALRENRPGLWPAYAAAASLGVYTHITMLFVIAGQGITYLLEVWMRRSKPDRDRWAGLVLGFGLAGLITLLLHSLVLPQISGGMERTVSVVNAWKKPLWTLFEIFRGLQVNFAGTVAGIAALVVFAAGMWSFARKEPRVLVLLLVPPLLGGGLVLAAGHHLWPRFFFFSFGFAVLVAVRGAFVLEQFAAGLYRRRPIPEMGILCAAMVAVSAISVPSAFAPKQDYEGAMAFVEAERKPGDAVLMAGLIAFPYQNLYKPAWQRVASVEELNAIRTASKRTLVLCTLEAVLASTDPEMAASLKRDFRLLQKFPGTLQNGTVYVYVADRPLAAATSALAARGN